MRSISTDTGNDHVARLVATSRRFALLGPGRERDLVLRWREKGDRGALGELVGCHLRLVIRIARDNRGYGLPLADLIGEGNVGLMEAVGRFDPDRGVRFATYAQWWIRTKVIEHVLRNWSSVRIGTTSGQKKLFFNLARVKRSLGIETEGDMSQSAVANVAATLRVPTADVVEMNRRLAHTDLSLNTPVDAEGETSVQDLLADDTPNQEAVLAEADEWRKRWQLVAPALAELRPRERQVLTARRLTEHPEPLRQLAAAYSLSPERIRQIENQALKKLAKAVGAAGSGQSSRTSGHEPRELSAA